MSTWKSHQAGSPVEVGTTPSLPAGTHRPGSFYPRPVDWNLQVCGIRGHATYAPEEPSLRARLHLDSPLGEAWRCLRCGAYVIGEPRGSGPADAAPEVPRGRLLRDLILMRLLAVDRGLRAVLMIIAAILVTRFAADRINLLSAFDTDLALLEPLERQLSWNVDDSPIVRFIHEAFTLSNSVLNWMTVGLFAYALLLAVEAVGLWLVKRWGEYFSVIATSVFLPLEIYELVERVTALRLIALVINLLAVGWLLWSKRLFGLRGGGAAYHAEHASESLLSVERAAAERA
jgi:uncharacterized membrane protein (DUF2068 family)